jgi:hypothetical protein
MPLQQGHGPQTGSWVSSIQRIFQVSHHTWNLEMPWNLTAYIQKKLDRGFSKLENIPKNLHDITNNELWSWKKFF